MNRALGRIVAVGLCLTLTGEASFVPGQGTVPSRFDEKVGDVKREAFNSHVLASASRDTLHVVRSSPFVEQALAVPSRQVPGSPGTAVQYRTEASLFGASPPSGSFSTRNRLEILQSLTKNPPEHLTIGGGVAGLAKASELARLGKSVGLVEQGDLGSGASSNSTRLGHAGLRYFILGDKGYVEQEMEERLILERIVPHCLTPFSYFFPTTGFRNRIMGWVLRPMIGRYESLHQHVAQRIRFPLNWGPLQPMKGMIEIRGDARLMDNRFAIAWAQEAARLGVRIVSYARAEAFHEEKGLLRSIMIRDVLTERGKTYVIRSPHVVNAAGSGIDAVREMAGLPGKEVTIIEGIHVYGKKLDNRAWMLPTNTPGRFIFVQPVPGQDRSFIGTTERKHQGPPATTRANEAHIKSQVRELLTEMFAAKPEWHKGRSIEEAVDAYIAGDSGEPLFVQWGSRPLQRTDRLSVLASRDHRIVLEKWMLSIVGMKLTGVRRAIRDAIQKLLDVKIEMMQELLPGSDVPDFARYRSEAVSRWTASGWSHATVNYLLDTYGTRTEVILNGLAPTSDLAETLENQPWIYAEAAYAANFEFITTLSDFLLNRTGWARCWRLDDPALDRLSRVIGKELSWDEAERAAQILRFKQDYNAHVLTDSARYPIPTSLPAPPGLDPRHLTGGAA